MDRCRTSLGLLLLFVLLTGISIVVGGGDRRLGSLVLGALAVLVLVDAASLLTESGGADIGAGLVRVAGLVVIAVATARLAREVAGSGPAR